MKITGIDTSVLFTFFAIKELTTDDGEFVQVREWLTMAGAAGLRGEDG